MQKIISQDWKQNNILITGKDLKSNGASMVKSYNLWLNKFKNMEFKKFNIVHNGLEFV